MGQLTGCAVVCALLLASANALSQPAPGERRASATLSIYSDNDHMTVVSPSTGLQTPINDAVSFDTRVTADVISGASVDVISEASPTAIEETRLEVSAGMSWRLHRLATARGRVIGSHERDYDSWRINLGANVELAQRNTTLDLDYTAGKDDIGSAVDPTFVARRTDHRLAATLTQILDRRTYLDLVVEAQHGDGFHASVYRHVPIVDTQTTALLRVPEQTPRLRQAIAMLLRARRALDPRGRFALHASYRFYVDDWGVASHTGALSSILALSDRAKLGASLRGYLQSGAEFYQPRYALVAGAVPELRTRDRRLGQMRTLFGSVTLDYGLSRDPAAPRLVVACALMKFWWPEFPAQGQRTAAVLTLGASSAF